MNGPLTLRRAWMGVKWGPAAAAVTVLAVGFSTSCSSSSTNSSSESVGPHAICTSDFSARAETCSCKVEQTSASTASEACESTNDSVDCCAGSGWPSTVGSTCACHHQPKCYDTPQNVNGNSIVHSCYCDTDVPATVTTGVISTCKLGMGADVVSGHKGVCCNDPVQATCFCDGLLDDCKTVGGTAVSDCTNALSASKVACVGKSVSSCGMGAAGADAGAGTDGSTGPHCRSAGPGRCGDKPELNHCNCGAGCYRDSAAAGSGYSCHITCMTDDDCMGLYDHATTCQAFTADVTAPLKECR